jgi:PTS system nitrogen regulatory IIA component
MNSLAQLFTSKEVLLDLDVQDKGALFAAVGQLLQEHRGLVVATVVDALSAREKLDSTGLGEGVAIPHARMEGLSGALATVVRVNAPIAFDAPDGKLVTYFFVLLVPVQATEQHLQILTDVAQLFADEQFRQQIDMAKSQDEMYRLFSTWTGADLRKAA